MQYRLGKGCRQRKATRNRHCIHQHKGGRHGGVVGRQQEMYNRQAQAEELQRVGEGKESGKEPEGTMEGKVVSGHRMVGNRW